jgi:hypothetical protein
MKIAEVETKVDKLLTDRYVEYPPKALNLWERRNLELRKYLYQLSSKRLNAVEGLRSGSKI